MRLGLTHRFLEIKDYGEVWECVDSALPLYLENLGFEVIGLYTSSDVKRAVSLCEGFVLSGGNDIGEFQKRDSFESSIIKQAFANNKKVLGICRGAQMLGTFFNLELVNSSHKIRRIHKLDSTLEVFQKEVTSFHHFGFKRQSFESKNLRIYAVADDEVEAFGNDLSLGLMWHIEREKNAQTIAKDAKMIKAFFENKSF